ncbi:MAG: SDR family NAD(P)-dependent oxidoreductase, partial [Candidatus Aminicenantes bacterium]|nr:SDR family NAD(P)-dependent oxidoreductase [Candidatus Aminicenantes bacterium]
MLFQDKVAIITGASQGIGKNIALTLAAEGAHVCVFDIVQEGAEEVVREIRNAGGNASVHRLDVSDSNQVSAAVEAVVKNLSS